MKRTRLHRLILGSPSKRTKKTDSFLKKLKAPTTQTEVSGHENVDPARLAVQSLLNCMWSEVDLMSEVVEESSMDTVMQPAECGEGLTIILKRKETVTLNSIKKKERKKRNQSMGTKVLLV